MYLYSSVISTSLFLEDCAFLPVSTHYPHSNHGKAVLSLFPWCIQKQEKLFQVQPCIQSASSTNSCHCLIFPHSKWLFRLKDYVLTGFVLLLLNHSSLSWDVSPTLEDRLA